MNLINELRVLAAQMEKPHLHEPDHSKYEIYAVLQSQEDSAYAERVQLHSDATYEEARALIKAHKNALLAIEALRGLLECAELNQDDLEDSTRKRIADAWEALP